MKRIRTEDEDEDVENEGGGIEEGEEEEEEEQSNFSRPEFYEKLTEDQKSRFEEYSRATFPHYYITAIASEAAGSGERASASTSTTTTAAADKKIKVGAQFRTALGGAAKVLVVELTEEARTIMSEQGASGKIQPEHIVEAYRRLLKRDSIFTTSQQPNKKLFQR